MLKIWIKLLANGDSRLFLNLQIVDENISLLTNLQFFAAIYIHKMVLAYHILYYNVIVMLASGGGVCCSCGQVTTQNNYRHYRC